MSATAPTDVFTNLEESAASEFAHWIELLQKEKNRRGLCRITIEAFLGRKGYLEIAELQTSTKDNLPIEGSGDIAQVSAIDTARAGFLHAQRYHKREAISVFRMQLWNLQKKGGDPTRGEYASIRFLADGTPDAIGLEGGGALNALAKENGELRSFVKDLLSAQVQMAQSNAATMLSSIEVSKVVAQERLDLAERQATLNMRATPEDWNRRVDSLAKRLEKPFTRAVSMLAVHLNQQKKSAGPADAAGDGGQGKAAEFFASLTGDQPDRLREAFGDDCWNAIVDVIHGPADQWMRERENLGKILKANQMVLLSILTPEQIATLQAMDV